MKIKTVFIAAMLAVSGFTQAQQVSKEAFEKAVNFLNCKTVELSLKEDAPNFQKYQKKCPCNESSYTQVRSFLDSVGKYSATIALFDEIESLKKSFKKDWKQDEAVTFLCETIFTDKTKYQKLLAFSDKRKSNSAFEALKRVLKIELKKIFDEQAKAQTIIGIETRLDSLEQKTKPKVGEKGWFDGFTFQIDVFSIIISVTLTFVVLTLVVLIFVTMRIKNVPDIVKKYVNIPSIVKKYVNEEISKATSQIGELKGEIKDLKDEVQNRKNEIGNLDKEINNLKHKNENQVKHELQSRQVANQPEIKTETFFLSNPNSDGSFNVSSVSPVYREGASIYKFTKTGNNRAEFQIDDREASVRLALSYPDKSIDPVCEALNALNPNAKRITTVEPGKAELVNDRWVVIKNQKSKIRYEI